VNKDEGWLRFENTTWQIDFGIAF